LAAVTLGSQKPVLKWKNRSFIGETIFPTDFKDGRELYETLMAAAGRDLAGVIGAPSSGIELVLANFSSGSPN
jgi:hypothetical protein